MPLSNLDPLSLIESRISAAERPDELEDNLAVPDELFTNADIPYPIVNDKRDLEVVNRQVKNQLRQFEASRNNPSYDQQADSGVLERLKKQNEYINVRMRIERLKRMKTKTQREKEQNKKQFHHLLQVRSSALRCRRTRHRRSHLFEGVPQAATIHAFGQSRLGQQSIVYPRARDAALIDTTTTVARTEASRRISITPVGPASCHRQKDALRVLRFRRQRRRTGVPATSSRFTLHQ